MNELVTELDFLVLFGFWFKDLGDFWLEEIEYESTFLFFDRFGRGGRFWPVFVIWLIWMSLLARSEWGILCIGLSMVGSSGHVSSIYTRYRTEIKYWVFPWHISLFLCSCWPNRIGRGVSAKRVFFRIRYSPPRWPLQGRHYCNAMLWLAVGVSLCFWYFYLSFFIILWTGSLCTTCGSVPVRVLLRSGIACLHDRRDLSLKSVGIRHPWN